MTNPQPTDGVVYFSGAIQGVVSVEVHIRQRWWDTWVLSDDLVCTKIAWQSAPNVGYCELEYRYGPCNFDGQEKILPRLSIEGWYVRVTVTCVDGVRKWHGFVDDVGEYPDGFIRRNELNEDNEPVVILREVGKQIFVCAGMLAALNRTPIMSTVFETTAAFQAGQVRPSTPELVTYNSRTVALSAPWFNPSTQLTFESGRSRAIGNRSATEIQATDFRTDDAIDGGYTDFGDRNSYLFTWSNLYNRTNASENLWSIRDILKYLAIYASPREKNNLEQIPVWIVDDALSQVPTFVNPELDCEGKTFKTALDTLFNTDSGISYWVWVDDETDKLMIEPFSNLDQDFIFGSGETFPANAKTCDLHCAQDPATSYTLQRSVSALTNQIVIRGAKRVTIATLPFSTVFDPGWTSAELTAFNTAFPPAAAENLPAVNARRDALSSSQYSHLFRNFVVKTVYDWRVAGAAGQINIFERDQLDPSFTYVVTTDRYCPYPLRVRFLSVLPLKQGIDYATGDPKAAHKASRLAFRRMELYGKAHGLNFVDGINPTMVGKPQNWASRAKRDVHYNVNDPDYLITPRPLDSDIGLGVELDVQGASQEIFSGTSPSSYTPQVPTNSLFLTVAIEEDRYCEVSWPEVADIPSVDGVLRRVFNVGSLYQLIKIKDQTIVGFNDTDFIRRTSDTYIQDDTPTMLKFAKQLHKWYTTTRNVIRMNSRRATATVWPGQLIKKVNPGTVSIPNPQEASVNCVVTEVAMSFPISQTTELSKATFSIVTSRGDVDFVYYMPQTV
jgi:hypothetical protein